jgi:hypothetical protein
MGMTDRFASTAADAAAAIERARERETAARRRRHALEQRIAELDSAHPPHRTAEEVAHATEAEDRAARAAESSERARHRAEQAEARAGRR